jgi:hypothetical protein
VRAAGLALQAPMTLHSWNLPKSTRGHRFSRQQVLENFSTTFQAENFQHCMRHFHKGKALAQSEQHRHRDRFEKDTL